MSVYSGPQISNGGLVLSLDASNLKSLLRSVEVLVVAGGGGGGMDMGGGGGGGGVIYSSALSITPGSAITATVGNGGVGAPAGGTNGQSASHQFNISAAQGGNSIFGALTAIGGGYGGSSYFGYTPNYGYGGIGGSGGGNSGYTAGATTIGADGTAGQGFKGGNAGGGSYYSGGGGGAGGSGADGPNQPNGGPGVYYSSMSPYYFGGGGGGASYSLSAGGNGGIGGGGGGAVGTTTGGVGLNNGYPGGGGSAGSQTNTPGGNAGANTGGGGGGGSHYNLTNQGGDGGSGIVIVRYPGSQRASGGTVTFVAGHTIHTFTTSGTFTPNFADITGNGNNGTLTNGSTYDSAYGGSLVFDGVDDSGIVSNNMSPGTGDFAVSVWVNKSDLVANRYIWDFGANGGTLATGTSITGGFRYYNPTVGYILGPTHDINTWYNITISRISNVTSFYSNGTLINSGTDNGNIGSWGTALTIGNYGGGGGYTHQGKISNILVYKNKGLTTNEVQQNFNALRGRYGI